MEDNLLGVPFFLGDDVAFLFFLELFVFFFFLGYLHCYCYYYNYNNANADKVELHIIILESLIFSNLYLCHILIVFGVFSACIPLDIASKPIVHRITSGCVSFIPLNAASKFSIFIMLKIYYIYILFINIQNMLLFLLFFYK